jgi:hypothetical protein
MNQVISILDNYAYPTLVWGIYVVRSDDERSQPRYRRREPVSRRLLI